MGVYKRSEGRSKGHVWWISYHMSGKQYRESSGSTNKRTAENILAVRKAQLFEGRWNLPKSKSPKLSEFTNAFLASIFHEKTKSRYRSSLGNLQKYFGPNIRISEITAESICSFQQARLASGIGKATINRDTATLSSMLSRARRTKLIGSNPCNDVEKLNERRDRRQARPLTYQEEISVKHYAVPWLSVLITLLVETGLRVKKEALALRWDEIQLQLEPSCIYIKESKTAAGTRSVWLTQHCRETLLAWQALSDRGCPFIFPSPRKAQIHVVDYKPAWKRAAIQAGISDRRIYDLRATFASRANACNATNLTLAHLLGHASTRILPTYVKPLDENTRTVIAAMDKARSLQKHPSD